MSILKGKKGIVFGALNEASIAWKVAELCAKEGAEIVLTNAPVSARVGQTAELAEKLNAPLIYADVTKMEDLETLVSESMDKLGGKLDFVLHSVGMSLNVRKKKTLHRFKLRLDAHKHGYFSNVFPPFDANSLQG